MDIKLDVNKVLSDIAEGLGVAVEKIYPILYKQAIIEGVYNLVSILFLMAIWVVVYKFGKAFKKAATNDFKNNKSTWSDNWFEHVMDKYMFQSVVGGIFSFFIIALCVGSLIFIPELFKDAMTAFFNTDYYIINDIVDKFSSK